jgi:hypothetical protein
MDQLEKEIIEQFGNDTLLPRECNKILKKAAEDGYIERAALNNKITKPMDTSSLLEYISSLRRHFLISENFNAETFDEQNDVDDALENSILLKKVFKAFLEFERVKTAPKTNIKKRVWLVIFSLLILISLFLCYRPAPY